ncbi:MAG: GNAT family N-acetyltransferase, partial [Ruminococcaceae bacterium]|nr:GNAT family N-acetyltransferase [Oscillospiraceae bacterium]
MIRKVNEQELSNCVNVIKESFITVANDFGFTIENAPRFTAFATTEDRL